jgi:glycolate oxidase FAD binding subunit
MDKLRKHLESIVGAANVRFEPDVVHRNIWTELSPKAVALPEDREQICELMRLANTERLKVVPVGHGSKLHTGGVSGSVDFALSLERLNRVWDYPASDLTITVEAGLPIRNMETTLAAKRQMLPLDVPFANEGTIGGTLAANVNGPRRLAYGTWRDMTLGVQFVTAEGKLAKGGGKVVKNVAGYDVPKLMIGSLGTLGVIVEATFKVFPAPPGSATMVLRFSSTDQAARAALRIVHSQLLPQALVLADTDASDTAGKRQWRQEPGTLLVGVAGTEQVLGRYERELPGLIRQDGLREVQILRDGSQAELWGGVQKVPANFLEDHPEGSVVKASVPLTQIGEYIQKVGGVCEERHFHHHTVAHAGSGVVFTYVWKGADDHKEDRMGTVCELLVRVAERAGGRGTVEWCPPELKRKIALWGTLRDDFASMRALKAALDPGNLLCPGRFYGGI